MNTATLEPTVLLRRDGAVLHITLNRPEVRNAMSQAMVRELRDALQQAEADGSTRVVVLRGAGGHFCAGGDIKDMARSNQVANEEDAAAQAQRTAAGNANFGHLCAEYSSTGLAVVAVVEGNAMGGGFGLACVADVVLAGTSAVFRLSETSLGLVPAQIAAYLVERLGYSEARRLAVSGGKLNAEQALALRLVHEVHAAGALESVLGRTLNEILQCAPAAIAATKRLIAKARFTPPVDLIDEAAALFTTAVRGPEGAEGTLAFVQKRKPAWAPQ